MKVRKNTLPALTAVVLMSAFSWGCGNSSSSSSSSTQNEDGTSPTTVGSLTGLPDLTTVLGSSSSTSLALSDVSGTPPLFKDINKDTVETNLTGSISDLKSAVESANGSSDVSTLTSKVETFREGVGKCHVIQDAARTMADISTFTGSSCYMSKIDAVDSTVLNYESGIEAPKGELFNQADETRIVALNINGGSGLVEQPERIIFEIQGRNVDPNIYQVKLNFCSPTTKTSNAFDLIRVDNQAGRLIIQNGQKQSDGNYFAEVNAPIRVDPTDSSKYEFLPGLARVISLNGEGTNGTDTFKFQAALKLEKDILTTVFREQRTDDHDGDGTKTTSRDRGYSVVRLDGSKTTETRIFEGAGRTFSDFQDESGTRHTHDHSIGFAYDESASPRFKSLSSGSFYDKAVGFDSSADDVLKRDEPATPDVSGISDTPCSLDPESTYSIDFDSAGMQAIQSQCESGFDGDESQLCDAVHEIEDTVNSARQAHGID